MNTSLVVAAIEFAIAAYVGMLVAQKVKAR
jgi:hypothetical protein